MKGARDYAKLFSTGQYGRLYIVSGDHARGLTFHIFVLPEGEIAIFNGKQNAPLNKDVVEVYGITGGQPGWTETYGWLHEGKWQEDFNKLVELRILKKETQEECRQQQEEDRQSHDNERISGLLARY